MPAAPPLPFDPAYAVGAGGLTPGYTGPGAVSPASFGAPPGALQNPAAFGGMPSPFNAGQGGIMPNPGYQLPPLQNPSYNPGGGFMPAPIGGQWNQIAQQMAGPMFMPQGVSAMGGPMNPQMPTQPSGVTVPNFAPPPGSHYLAPHLYMPSTPTQTAPNPVSAPNPVQIPPGTPRVQPTQSMNPALLQALMGGGGGGGYISPMAGRPGISRF